VSEIVRSARAIAHRSYLQRVASDPFRIALDCFSTFDAKDRKARLSKPWLEQYRNDKEVMDSFRSIHDELERGFRGEIDEFVAHKTKQTFFSWSASGFATEKMVLHPGVRCYAQSRKDEVSRDLVERVVYILEHLRGPLEGAVEKDDLLVGKNSVTLKSIAGQPRECLFEALPQGSEQWRFLAATIAILDEAAYGIEQMRTHAAAVSACEGGGFLIYQSTGVYGTHFNEYVSAFLARADLEGVSLETNDTGPEWTSLEVAV
jgi:hypothetical protein